MKLKDIVNKDVPEIMKKLLYGLDYRTTYVVEFLHDTSVIVKEVDVVRDKKSGNIICYKDKEWGEFMITLPIWLFILCIIIGFPLAVIILTFIGYTVYLGFQITIEILKSLW